MIMLQQYNDFLEIANDKNNNEYSVQLKSLNMPLHEMLVLFRNLELCNHTISFDFSSMDCDEKMKFITSYFESSIHVNVKFIVTEFSIVLKSYLCKTYEHNMIFSEDELKQVFIKYKNIFESCCNILMSSLLHMIRLAKIKSDLKYDVLTTEYKLKDNILYLLDQLKQYEFELLQRQLKFTNYCKLFVDANNQQFINNLRNSAFIVLQYGKTQQTWNLFCSLYNSMNCISCK